MAEVSETELDEFAASIRDYCRERLPAPTQSRPGVARDVEVARVHWQQMCAELGIGGLLVPKRFGGDGAGLTEGSRMMEALGAELAAVPALSSAVMAPVLLTALAKQDTESPAGAILRRICSGAIVAIAWADTDPGAATPERLMVDYSTGAADSPRAAHSPRIDESRSADGSHREAATEGSLADSDEPGNGGVARCDSASTSYRYVIDGDMADVLILIGDGGRQIAAVEASALSITPRPAFDLLRGFADIQADAVPIEALAEGSRARDAFDEMLIAGRLAVAAECAGGAQQALVLAVEYAKQRVQFGREIGSFQAVKHLLADAFVNAESATSLARLAAAAYVSNDSDAAELVAAASFYCADRFSDVAATGIQVHGGIGFTVECAAHLYRRRAESDRHILGDPAVAKREYLSLLSAKEATA